MTRIDPVRAGVLPAPILAVALMISAIIGIVRAGLPEFAWPMAMPQFVTIAFLLASATVVARRRSMWWVPLAGCAVVVLAIVAVVIVTADKARGTYIWTIPWVGGFVLFLITLYWALGLIGARRDERRGGLAWTAFVLLVLATPVWTGILLLLAVLDTPMEDALPLTTFGVMPLGATLAVAGCGLGVARHQVTCIVGATLLSLYVIVTGIELALADEAWHTALVVVCAATAAVLTWVRALRPSTQV